MNGHAILSLFVGLTFSTVPLAVAAAEDVTAPTKDADVTALPKGADSTASPRADDMAALHKADVKLTLAHQDRFGKMPDAAAVARLKAWAAAHPDDAEGKYWGWYVTRNCSGKVPPAGTHKAVEEAAAAGFRRAQWQCAIDLTQGDGVEVDIDLAAARRWADEAVKSDADGGGHAALGLILMQPGATEAQLQEAHRCFDRAIELGQPSALRMRGLVLLRRGRYTPAFENFQRGVEAGDPEAKAALANCYREGWGTAVDHAREFQLASEAADAGAVGGYIAVARCYQEGSGVEKDMSKAYKYYRRAAMLGDVESRFWAALFLIEGTGIKADPEAGARAMLYAAGRGYDQAQLAVGVAYLEGTWMPEDEQQARIWLKKAKESGNARARALLDKLDE